MKIYKNKRLTDFTTYGVGGAAKKILIAECKDELIEAYGENGYIMGGGSKILAADDGYDGTVVINRVDGIKFEGERVVADSGAYLSLLVRQCEDRGLSGLEFACQIPATVGGAVVMNAGAFDKSLSDVVEYVEVLRGGKIIRLSADECGFSYRKSVFARSDDLILSVGFLLEKSDCVSENIFKFKQKRRNQPKGRSCGSVFKNGERPAAELIDRAGLKGFRQGGAIISPVHANFIINEGGATASDIYCLISTAKREVQSKFGVSLKEEVIYLGDF